MATGDATEKIVRIVDHQTTPEQPDIIPKHTITMLATRNGLFLDAATAALDDAPESGQLSVEDRRFRVA